MVVQVKELYPFNSHKWPKQNFSLQYQYNSAVQDGGFLQ